jgi:hypothetical protein
LAGKAVSTLCRTVSGYPWIVPSPDRIMRQPAWMSRIRREDDRL